MLQWGYFGLALRDLFWFLQNYSDAKPSMWMGHLAYTLFCFAFDLTGYIFSRRVTKLWSLGLPKIWASTNQNSKLAVQNLFQLLYDQLGVSVSSMPELFRK